MVGLCRPVASRAKPHIESIHHVALCKGNRPRGWKQLSCTPKPPCGFMAHPAKLSSTLRPPLLTSRTDPGCQRIDFFAVRSHFRFMLSRIETTREVRDMIALPHDLSGHATAFLTKVKLVAFFAPMPPLDTAVLVAGHFECTHDVKDPRRPLLSVPSALPFFTSSTHVVLPLFTR